MSASATIEVDEYLPHPVSTVWKALTSSDRLAVWLMPNDFAPEVGRRFTLDTGNWGLTECEVLEVQPERLLRYSWRNGPLDTEVTFRLVPEGHGTRLLLEHRGFDLDHPVQRFAYEGMRRGWRSEVLAGLRAHVFRRPLHRPVEHAFVPHVTLREWAPLRFALDRWPGSDGDTAQASLRFDVRRDRDHLFFAFDVRDRLAIDEERRLDHLGEPRGALTARERRERGDVGEHGVRLVERTDEVLPRGDVDRGLAADRRVGIYSVLPHYIAPPATTGPAFRAPRCGGAARPDWRSDRRWSGFRSHRALHRSWCSSDRSRKPSPELRR